MGRGGALEPYADAPRLTNVLRALTVEHSPEQRFDVDAHTVARQKDFAQRQASSPLQATNWAAEAAQEGAALTQHLFGNCPYGVPPRPAKEAHARFLQAVQRLLCSEVSSAELREACMTAWAALEPLPPPERSRGKGNTYLIVGPHREALTAALGGGLCAEAVEEVVLCTQELKSWRNKLGDGANLRQQQQCQSQAGQQEGRGVVVGGGDVDGQEFGWDLDFVAPNESVSGLQMLGVDTAGMGLGPASVGRGEPSPQELRALAAQGVQRVGQQQQQQGGTFSLFAEEEAEEDLGEEYEEGKRLREINLHWIQRWAERVSGQKGDGAATMAESAAAVLLQEEGPDAAAMQLLDMTSESATEDVMLLMENRKLLREALQVALSKLRVEEEAASHETSMPAYGSQVTITSDSAKLISKLQRKEARKDRAKKGQVSAVDLELLSALGWKALLDTERDHSSTLILGDGLEFKVGGEGAIAGAKKALPTGTTRKTYKGYEEVHVPAPPCAPPPSPDELVKISELDEWVQLCFQGYKTLNRIQSRIFQTAFTSNENMLVCAPTGAGKTNIAMISVLREVGQNMRYGVIQKADFKIVYVAPMKALAAEVVANFSNRLKPLGLLVRELTGDMQLTKKELEETQMIVTTPEKWDVITRKGGDVSIASLVKLLIIDEVHLLNDDRGPVIETLVARTQRQVEASQAMIRVVGLSATLPNYQDVATFLNVNPTTGLFYFDSSYRPVPLALDFIGVTVSNFAARNSMMTEICYNKVADSLKRGYQAMVFVHSRKDTGKTARTLADLAARNGDLALFDNRDHPKYGFAQKDVKKSRNREVTELFDSGFGIHNAGMLRSDRTLTERLFADGVLKVIVCTATLAWGVNLPAHTVIIKGTQVYDAQKGTFAELGMLDVQQIFGRAGRPQFDTSGEAVIITSHAKLAHYLGMLTSQLPIESQFKAMLVDNLNAEIVLGTVSNVREASTWLSYTYLHTRMSKNPLSYGITYQELATDPSLESHKRTLIIEAAKQLKAAQMAVFDERSGNLYVTELGRVASHYYIRHQSMVTFNSLLKPHMTEAEVLSMVAQSSEFESMMVREEEMPEVEKLSREACPFDVKGGIENKHGKANILLQASVSRARVESFSLVADMMYMSTNAPRILRAVFEIALRRKWSSLAETCLTLCKCMEHKLWPDSHPLRQFEHTLSPELLWKLEDRGLGLMELQDMSASDIGSAVRHPAAGALIAGCMAAFPRLSMTASLHPITRTVLRVQLSIRADFEWRERAHGQALRWLVLVEDSANEHIYHSESWLLTKKMAREGDQMLAFTIPIFEPLPSQYFVRALSEDWLGAEELLPLNFSGLILPERMPPNTELLDLDPLPLSALSNPAYESLYTGKFTHFNPIQTQAFHILYHTDENVLLGAPTGSGKTISAELCMMRVFNQHPDSKIIYIAPLKALVRERVDDWGRGLCARLGKSLVELTGDYTPDLRALLAANIIIATPEKWDGISRNWQSRAYVKKVGLVIIDEIHLLGADRGPILEVIVSRMRYIAGQTDRHIRFVGLSTALANAQDLGAWLGISNAGLFNFKPSVRPVPLEAHIQGFPGKFYCPRMASMNKPAYAAIQMHSPTKPVLIFVSSRRQTRLTALDLITCAVGNDRPQQWVHMAEDELEEVCSTVRDSALKHTLQFGIGLHHAGLNERDRTLVETLFVEGAIQVLVATSTLAWGVNTPAHLVIIKGTEYYDAPTKRYIDFPITDVLQMMGRAGRPQYDRHGYAVIMVHEPKKQFYKRFLYEPFPVESSLANQLADHLNAEVVSGTITCVQDAMDYLTWTYFYRRLLQNPSYYDLNDTSPEAISEFLSNLVRGSLEALESAGCISLGAEDEEGGGAVEPTTAGRVASFYYLRHTTMEVFARSLGPDQDVADVLQVLCLAPEYDELPVRHNEDKLNSLMARSTETVRVQVDMRALDDPHIKASLLLQAHMSRAPLPISDYITDTKGVLDNSLRILQAMVDVAADAGWLETALSTINLVQSLMQGRWIEDCSLMTLPHISPELAEALTDAGCGCLPMLMEAVSTEASNSTGAGSRGNQHKDGAAKSRGRGRGAGGGGQARGVVVDVLAGALNSGQVKEVLQVCEWLPVIEVQLQRPYLPSKSKTQQQTILTPPLDLKLPNHHTLAPQGETGALPSSCIHQQLHPSGAVTYGFEPGGWGEVEETDGVGGYPSSAHSRSGGEASSSFGGVSEGDENWVVEVDLQRLRGGRGSGGKKGRPRVYAPRFPKVKEEGWYLIAGDISTHELLALKRVGLEDKTTVKLSLPRYNGAGQLLHEATIYLMSDSYIGLDQQYTLQLIPGSKTAAAPRAAQPHLVHELGWGKQKQQLASQLVPQAEPADAQEDVGGVCEDGQSGLSAVDARRERRAAQSAARAAQRKAAAEAQQSGAAGVDLGAGSAVALGVAQEGQQL